MKALPEFRLESHFSRWEFKARHHMTASDAQSMSLAELLAMASDEDREGFEHLWLGYTETYGAPDLREAIAALYAAGDSGQVLCFAGASEAIFAAHQVLLDADSHAITITPNYQSHESLPLSICATTGVPLEADDHWSLDIDRIAAAIRPNTRMITINFPHNPTGAILPRERLDALVKLCRKHGIYLFSDEILNMYVFKILSEVRELTENWIREYNEERPHDSLGDLTPWEYRVKHEGLENPNYTCN